MITMVDLVSIIMPTCNRPYIICRAINSVLRQSHDKWELIIIDDASDYNIAQAIRKYVIDKRIRVIRLDYHAGGARVRNIGINMANGGYIALLDDDDIWYPEKLSIQKKYMDEYKDCCLIGCDFKNVSEYESHDQGIYGDVTKQDYIKSFFKFCPSSFIFTKKEYINNIRFDEKLKGFQDCDFVMQILEASGKKGYIIDQVLGIYNKSYQIKRITTNLYDRGDAFRVIVEKYQHMLSSCQVYMSKSLYHTLCAERDKSFIHYLKSVYYLLASGSYSYLKKYWKRIMWPVFIIDMITVKKIAYKLKITWKPL